MVTISTDESYRLFNGSTWGVFAARPFSMSIISCENRKSIQDHSLSGLFILIKTGGFTNDSTYQKNNCWD